MSKPLETVDIVLTGVVEKPKPGPERLHGAPEIAKAIGMSEDSIPKLARTAGVPIYKPPGLGRYFAYRSELERWLRTKPED